MKTCRRCKKDYPLESFYAAKRNADGRGPYCKPCHGAKREEWRNSNRDRVRANQNEYKKANRAVYTAAQGRRRASLENATPEWANQAEIRKHYDFAARFKESFGLDLHVDHIVPLKGKKVCGLHVENNLQVILAQDNLTKNNKFEVA